MSRRATKALYAFIAKPSNASAGHFMSVLMNCESEGLVGDDEWMDGLVYVRDFLLDGDTTTTTATEETSMQYTLIVKGDMVTAMEAVTNHMGSAVISSLHRHPDYHECIIVTNPLKPEQVGLVAKWFCEPPVPDSQIGFPHGTLLWYGPRAGDNAVPSTPPQGWRTA